MGYAESQLSGDRVAVQVEVESAGPIRSRRIHYVDRQDFSRMTELSVAKNGDISWTSSSERTGAATLATIKAVAPVTCVVHLDPPEATQVLSLSDQVSDGIETGTIVGIDYNGGIIHVQADRPFRAGEALRRSHSYLIDLIRLTGM